MVSEPSFFAAAISELRLLAVADDTELALLLLPPPADEGDPQPATTPMAAAPARDQHAQA